MTDSEHEGIPSSYNSSSVEQRLYKTWMEKGYFAPRVDPTKKPFVMIMPPPNATGELHLGHALTATIEDIMVRWHRMQGEPTLWLPGVDHAGIATQVVVERELAEQGLTRHDIGRDAFEKRVWEWVHRCRNRISEQHMRLGASCDWRNEQFTLDPGPSRAVRQTFINLYEKELIYRGERIINWCPRCMTALSDLEVEHRELPGSLYYIRYPLADSNSEYVTIATTRPETMLGDTGVAVNPNDERYQKLIGRHVLLPLLEHTIPIITDEAVDLAFGTGVLKITPGHDVNDFEIGKRNGLPTANVIAPDGTISVDVGRYAGMERFQAREAVVADLKHLGLLEKVEPHAHAVGHCQRCNQVVEPLVSKQWFVRVEPLAQAALEAVRDGRIRIVPERFNRVYENWMEGIRDWCISRQLWWGHRIPVWYCQTCDHQNVEVDDPSACSSCGSTNVVQDEDVLDTWFSSALWPHSTLGWPDPTEDMRYFYPTSVMETGYDILFFWVARMIMMGLENTGDVPFRTVYLHGLVRDVEGVKMSKILGNVIDPISTIESYGCDALRFALSTGNAPGNDMRLGKARLETGRNFANKLWNAARFVMGNLENLSELENWQKFQPEHLEDRWILSRLNKMITQVERNLKDYQFGEAGQAIYEFLWDEFCDWYIELAKVRLRTKVTTPALVGSPVLVLTHVLEKTLRLLHPFMPFITEELWCALVARLPNHSNLPESIVVADYPKGDTSLVDEETERLMVEVTGVVRAIRNARAEFQVEPRRPVEVVVDPADLRDVLEAEAEAIRSLARAEPLRLLEVGEPHPTSENSMTMVLDHVSVFIPMKALVDVSKERGRLARELEECERNIARLHGRLKDSQFLAKAPEEVVGRERQRLQVLQERSVRIQELLAQLPG